jgi:hypothetical protein
MASLNSIQLKVFRATQHIDSLKSELQGYFQSNPGKMVRQPHSREDEAVFRFIPNGSMPARFGLIIGDALQNLRSSLDYLVWELVLAANGQPNEKNMFPICSTVELFEEQIRRHRLDGVSVDAIAEIKRFQPYHLGQDFAKGILWAIDELTNINKHRRILLTNLMATTVPKENFVVQDGEVWIHHPAGPVQVFGSDTQFGPFPIIDGKVKVDAQIAAAIAFDEGPAKGMEISFCAGYWTYYILEMLLPGFQKFFL